MCAGPIHLGKFTYIIGPLAIIWVFFITALFVLPTVRHFRPTPTLQSPCCSTLLLCAKQCEVGA